MKNLWLFLVRYNAFFWFIIFFGVCLFLIVRYNGFQRASYINTSNIVVGSLYQKLNSWQGYLSLAETNKNLAEENALLRARIQNKLSIDTNTSVIGIDSITKAQYELVVAKVINNSVHHKSNYITLNKGSNDGVASGMGVIAPNGIVGIVINTSAHFSTVRSLLHPDTRFSVVLDSIDAFGSLVWDFSEDSRHAKLLEIPNHINVEKGSKVRTSGFSLFPADLLIGEVVETDISSGESFLGHRIKLNINFSTLEYVYIVKNNLQMEQDQLEAQNDDYG